ncbi:MAG TPA: FAD-binding oxidoreductase [Kofleriaceae bacterium]|nr:FAD-binding oxidoreductase [Kofleriaceae bacterium]
MGKLRTLDDGETTLSAEVMTAFRAGFRGQVLTPDDAGYDEQRRVWNAMIDRRPGLIVRCTGTADVVAAVKLARDHRLLVSVRGGGHNIAGLAVCDGGLMIDLSPMRGVIVDPRARIVRAQGGCTLGDVDRETQLHAQAAVLGFVSATGIAGLTTGGGFGYLTRQYGWTCDNVISMEVVTADGAVVEASADDNAELFWCLRGGSGNFGIVTAFTYRTFPLGPTILGGVMAWPAELAGDVLERFAAISSSAPRTLTLVSMMRNAPPAPWLPPAIHGKPMIGVLAFYDGPIAEGEALIAPLRALHPIADIVTARPYAQLQNLLDATQPKGRRYYWKSEYLAGVGPELFEVYRAQAARNTSAHSAAVLFQLGGALNELPADHSPVGNRDAKYVLNITGGWDSPADDAVNVAWVRDTWEAMRRFSTGGVYVNFLSDDERGERVTAAYGRATFDRLAALKRRYDPMNLFRHTKSFG